MASHLLLRMRRILSGNLVDFGGPDLNEEFMGRLRAEQIGVVLRHMPGIMLTNACNAFILVIALWHAPDRSFALAWAASVIALVAYFALRRLMRRRISKPSVTSARGIRRLIVNAVLLGSAWTYVPLTFFHGASSGRQLIVACLCSGMLGGGAFALASVPIAALAFMTPLFIGCLIALAWSQDPTYFLVGLLLAIYALALIRVVFTHAIHMATRLAAQFEAEHVGRRDSLTGLPNRLHFQEQLEAAFATLRASNRPFALFCFDLDNFKTVNDRHGHAAGDELLIQAAERLREVIREGDTMARLGGDEFVLAAGNVSEANEAALLAERIVAAFDRPFIINGQQIVSTASVGIAMAPKDGDDSRGLLRSADIALYWAKRTRGSFQFYEPRHDAKARQERTLEQNLRGALHRGEFQLAYQPFVDLRGDRIVGCEALLRWRHPVLGAIGPEEFIPAAEATGLIQAIGEWVIREACRTAAGWPRDLRIAINCSGVQLRDAALLPLIVNTLAANHLTPDRLEIEVTETVLIAENETALGHLKQLSSMGVRLALDDFGTGYSSLSYLRKLPFQRLKIDRSFISDFANSDSAAIVRSVVRLAADLGISTTAEGVETEEQRAFLRTLGCDELQGYLISPPLSAQELMQVLSPARKVGGGLAGGELGHAVG